MGVGDDQRVLGVGVLVEAPGKEHAGLEDDVPPPELGELLALEVYSFDVLAVRYAVARTVRTRDDRLSVLQHDVDLAVCGDGDFLRGGEEVPGGKAIRSIVAGCDARQGQHERLAIPTLVLIVQLLTHAGENQAVFWMWDIGGAREISPLSP